MLKSAKPIFSHVPDTVSSNAPDLDLPPDQVDPQLYLTQLLLNLPGWPVRDLDAWLPDQWKLRHAAGAATLNH